jgi:hypothetical protein
LDDIGRKELPVKFIIIVKCGKNVIAMTMFKVRWVDAERNLM